LILASYQFPGISLIELTMQEQHDN